MLTVHITLYLLLVSSNIDNVQSLPHGKCPNYEFAVLLTLLFLSGVKMQSPTRSQCISAGLWSCLLSSQCTAKRKSKSSNAIVASASGSLCLTKGTYGNWAQGAQGAELGGLAGQSSSAVSQPELLCFLRGVKQPLCAPLGHRPCTAKVNSKPACTADDFYGDVTVNSIHVILLNCLDVYTFYKKEAMCAYKGAHILGVSYYRCHSQWLTHLSVTWVAHIINIKCDIYYQEQSFGAAASPTHWAVNILIREQAEEGAAQPSFTADTSGS